MLNYKTLDKQDLQNALDNKEFELFYQPIMNFETDNFETFEAFIRWHHPTLGTLPPSIFMNNIEKYNLQENMTNYILNAAVEQVLTNSRYGFGETGININLTPKEFFNPTTITQLKDIIHKLPYPEYLGLEVSPKILTAYTEYNPNDTEYDPDMMPSDEEHLFLQDIRNVINQYIELGVTLALDTTDHVIGSLIRANVLGFHAVKISASALQNAFIKDPNSLAEHVQASKEINTPLIAVGIDHKTIFKNLHNNNFSYAQGFFLCPPLSLKNDKEFHEHLNNYLDKKKNALSQDDNMMNLHKIKDEMIESQNDTIKSSPQLEKINTYKAISSSNIIPEIDLTDELHSLDNMKVETAEKIKQPKPFNFSFKKAQ
ncbi:MAG: EAL domain-containing protein (putative c-di-GMP-specific phosphodiesterase class I) [Dasania sp.]|jgi:EAL domain-containing protein (putative c-di-GMP-specific phosphodiesterase class I)